MFKLSSDYLANFRSIASILSGLKGRIDTLFNGLSRAEQKIESFTSGISDAPGDGNTYGRENGAWVAIVSGSGSGDSVSKEITQAAHGFSVGMPVHLNGVTWEQADRDDATKSCDAIVSAVAGANDFTVLLSGWITLTTGEWDARTGDVGGLTAGEYYWLSSTAGGLVKTKPTTGLVQLILVAASTTTAIVMIGDVVDSTPSSGSITVTVDFGASFTHFAQTVVTGQSWVTANSEIAVTPLAASGAIEETALMAFSPVVSDLVAGDGFTLSVYTPTEAKGTYTFSCIGV